MKKKLYTIVLGLAIITLSACNNELTDINKNPNATEAPLPAYLLTASEKHAADLYWGSSNNYNTSLLFVQHWASIQYTETDCYNVTNSAFTSLWTEGYATLITNLNAIIASDQGNDNYKAVAQIFRSWVFLELTNAFGDVPYTEAGKSVLPKYDTQETIYNGLNEELKSAVAAINTSGDGISGDVIYNGNLTKWKRFGNSLRLRIALLLADRDESTAKSIAGEVKDGVFTSNSEIAQFIYSDSPQQNPFATSFDTRDDYRVSKVMVDKLKSLSDPRLPVFAQLPSDTSVGDYVGVPNGLTTTDANSLGFAKTSRPGTYFLAAHSPAVFFTYAEALFDLAEATARGFIAGNAETYYKQAIQASLNQFGITSASVINNYLSQSGVNYDASNYRKSIGTQKWIAFYGQGLDAFTEWRRLDYPELKAGPANVLEDKMPLRFFYPSKEQSLNGNNYTEAVKRQGPDLLITRLWFDIK
ncbi:MAG: Susd and RagB outer rane lipoprotein [Bacteroidetes bacterium]|nr:Susd and RagB outer rane lipoprotein [Bacteroidota bacterium]